MIIQRSVGDQFKLRDNLFDNSFGVHITQSKAAALPIPDLPKGWPP